MALLRCDGQPISFDLIYLEDTELAELISAIESEGGVVVHDENVTVKFTSRDAYTKNGPLIRATIYDVMFIKECIREKNIVEPEIYRLDERKGLDDYHVQYLLHGRCKHTRLWTKRLERRRQGNNAGLSNHSHEVDSLADQVVSVKEEPAEAPQPDRDTFHEIPMSTTSSEDSDTATSYEEYNEQLDTSGAMERHPNNGDQGFFKLRGSEGDKVYGTDSFARSVPQGVASKSERLWENDERVERQIDLNDGPSGAPVTTGIHVACDGKTDCSSFSHSPFDGGDEIEKPTTDFRPIKKISRGKEWRAKLKRQTNAQYTDPKSRKAYTPAERKTMLNYLIKNKCISRAKGLVIWTQMITDGYLTDRTPQSLHNQFRKCVLPKIEHTDWLEESDVKKFLMLRSRKR